MSGAPRWRALAALSLLLAAPNPASAHTTPYSYVDVRLERRAIEGRVAVHVVDLAHELGIERPDQLLDSLVTARDAAAIESLCAARLDVRTDGTRLAPQWSRPAVDPARPWVSLAFHAPLAHEPGVIEARGPMFPYDPAHQTFVNVYRDSALIGEIVLDHSRPRGATYLGGRRGTAAVVRAFVVAGVHHIFTGPDHMLFILALLLLGGGAARLLKIVTAFTVAHSVTLALATLGIVNPPPWIIEPAIALSIVAVGIENLISSGRRDLRAGLAFGFGFVHGFGFAGVLRDFGLPKGALGWSLFSFNLGVEIAQAAIMLAVAPALALLSARKPALARRVVAAGSALVVAAGTFWLVRRVLHPSP